MKKVYNLEARACVDLDKTYLTILLDGINDGKLLLPTW